MFLTYFFPNDLQMATKLREVYILRDYDPTSVYQFRLPFWSQFTSIYSRLRPLRLHIFIINYFIEKRIINLLLKNQFWKRGNAVTLWIRLWSSKIGGLSSLSTLSTLRTTKDHQTCQNIWIADNQIRVTYWRLLPIPFCNIHILPEIRNRLTHALLILLSMSKMQNCQRWKCLHVLECSRSSKSINSIFLFLHF